MTATPETRCTAFQRHTLIAQGPLAQTALDASAHRLVWVDVEWP